MPRLWGYSARGQRCTARHNWQARGRLNAIGALQGQSLLTACVFDSTIDTGVFGAWLRQDLIPKLPPEAVVVMDNASFHKRADIHNSLTEAGFFLEYLPPYSPDLNPIEKKWAQAKAIRRKHRCDVHDLFKHHIK